MSFISCESGVVEWRPSNSSHNLGDHLAWLLGERIFSASAWSRMLAEQKKRYVLLGSFLCDYNIGYLLDRGYSPVLIGCGYRGEGLSPQKIGKSIIRGCRGLLTKSEFAKIGLRVESIGDPAMILPLLVPRRDAEGLSILVPHICDEERHLIRASDVGVDEVIQAETNDVDGLLDLVGKISAAKFVFAGAMHAAVIAHAYGVPFAFYARKGGYLDCPVKWEDWLSSVSSGGVGCHFHSNIIHGNVWYRESVRRLKPSKLLPIVVAYSGVGRVRFRVFLGAFLHDLALLFRRG